MTSVKVVFFAILVLQSFSRSLFGFNCDPIRTLFIVNESAGLLLSNARIIYFIAYKVMELQRRQDEVFRVNSSISVLQIRVQCVKFRVKL